MDVHLLKVDHFCRFCKGVLVGNTDRRKQSTFEVLKLQYPEDLSEYDFENEDPLQFPKMACTNCRNKCIRWKNAFDKHKENNRRKPVNTREEFKTNLSIIPLSEITTGLVCSKNPDCVVCSHVLPNLEIGPSPSKIIKISEVASISPRDELNRKKRKSDHHPKAGLASVKLDFQKGARRPSGEIELLEPETIKIYTETKDSKSHAIENCFERDQAVLLSCKFCKRFSSQPVISSVCHHIFCDTCFLNFKSSVKTTICPGSASEACGKSVGVNQVEPLSGLLRNLHSSINVFCSQPACKESFPVNIIQNHEKSCKKRGSYKHSNMLLEDRDNVVGDRVGEVFDMIDKQCEERKEDTIDVLFYKLVSDLKKSDNDLHKAVQNIYKSYSRGENEYVEQKVDVLQAVALKSECNLTVGQYRGCRKFSVKNNIGTNLFLSYEKVLHVEGDLDCGNVDYVVLKDGEVLEHHEAAPNSSTIDVDSDFGCMSFEMLNPNIEGNRVSLRSSVCKEVQELYPLLVKLCDEKYPNLDLSQQTLAVRTKLAFDGTKSTIRSDKDASRLEVPNWLRGTVCILSVNILDETSSEEIPLFRESNPNSGEANNIVLLWKADENNSATISLALHIYDVECKQMEDCIYEVKTKVQPETDENNADINQNLALNPDFIKQKIKIFVDKPKDEKLSRNAHGRAGAGSTYPCTYCTVTRTEASELPFSGRGEITLTNRLELEAGTYITQNPDKKSQASILGISLGQKGVPLTTAEPCQEPPDVLHEDINLSHPLFIIASRVECFGEEAYPEYTYVKKKDQKLLLEQSETVYMNKLLKFCPTMPNITQMPGNFCREFCAEENKHLILEPLPDCAAKTHFAEVMSIWRELRQVHKKSNPTEAEVDNYPNLVRRFLTLLNRHFPWFKPFPNQFHRLTHNFYFMTVDGNPLGVKSLEGLEKGNFTTQVMDAHHTYKGNRKKANKGVFKLLRLKSSRILRSFRKKKPSRVQRCSRCHKIGHNAKNKLCVAGLIAPDIEVAEDVVGDQEGAAGTVVSEADAAEGVGGADLSLVVLEEDSAANDSMINSSAVDLDELLRDSDEDLF